MNTNELLLNAINAWNIKSTSKDSLHQATASLRKALLNFGSDTDENKSCAEDLEFGFGETYDDIPVLGLKLKESGEFLSDFISTLEDEEVVELLVKLNPKLTKKEINSSLRIVTLVFIAIERSGHNRDSQCAELNRQEIGGESPLPGKV